ATSTATVTPTPVGDAMVIGEKGANLRTGPSTLYTPPIALLETNTQIFLSGRTENSRWYEVQTTDGDSGWIFSDLLEVYIDTDALPVTWFETPTPIPLMIGIPS